MRFAKSDITVNQTSEQSRDRKVILSYTFTSFCEQCWKKYIEGQEKKGGRSSAGVLALRKKRLDKMMEDVKEHRSKEQVPIRYAVDRLLSEIKYVGSDGQDTSECTMQ